MKRKYIYLAIVAVMAILLSIVYWKFFYKPEVVEIEDVQSTTVVQTAELPKNYTQYETNIAFKKGYFEGKHLIRYVHDGKTPVKDILIKLYLNAYSKDTTQLPYFMDNIPVFSNEQNPYGYINVSNITVNREVCDTIEKFTNLWVDLKNPLHQGQTVEIEMKIEGKIPEIYYQIGGNENRQWISSFLPQIAIFDEEEGWISPNIYNTGNYLYADIANYIVSCTVDRNIVPIASGLLLEEMDGKDGTKKYVFEAKRVRDFGIYLGPATNKFRIDLENGKKVMVYTMDTIDQDLIKLKLDKIFSYYGKLLGTYPYESFLVVDVPELKKPISYPNMLLDNLKELQLVEDEAYEAIGKQWIPYIIMHNPIKDGYLNTGLEGYLAMRGKMSLKKIKSYLEDEKSKGVLNKKSEIPYITYDNYYREEYLRPLEMFIAMEEMVGEEKWREILGEYYKKYAFKLPVNRDFITFFLEKSEMPIYRIFSEYGNIVYGEGEK